MYVFFSLESHLFLVHILRIAHKSFLLPSQEGRALSADLIATGS